jgi:hypothetical protein
MKQLSPEALEHLKAVLQEQDMELLSVSHPRSTLEELFLRIVGAVPVDHTRK